MLADTPGASFMYDYYAAWFEHDIISGETTYDKFIAENQ